MNSRSTVMKAVLSSICALFASVVLSLSVAETPVTASAVIAEPQPVEVAVVQKTETHLAAASSQRSSAGGVTLLPIVNQSTIHDAEKQLANAVLQRLPSLCRDHLKNFTVLYNKPKQRGLGGKSSIIVDGTVQRDEFIGLMIHECGHVIHGNLFGDPASGPTTFRDGDDLFAADSPAVSFFAISWKNATAKKKVAKSTDFVTGYASHDPFEDFAETFTMYVLERPSFEARALDNPALNAKLKWMNDFLPLPSNLFGIPLYSWKGNVPWDATKMPFVWKPVVLSNGVME